MAEMRDFEADIVREGKGAVHVVREDLRHLFHHSQQQPTFTARAQAAAPVQSSPSQQEEPVATPQQPASVVDSLHAITGEIQANKLVARLVQRRIGARLTTAQADHVVALIADLENPPAQAAQLPQDPPAPSGAGAGFGGDTTAQQQ